ncbi:unnamed protein product [Urochloa decumbens]|uniref:Ubiquitin-like protease family profile domain-containing protein n=1 Tax=Urochloa decumbens TaxID=240449 RepID=A0ABC9B2X9_9POAL
MVQTVCMPGKFAALCRNLNERQRAIVKQIGLDCLLSIPSMPIQRMLLESLVEKYNVIDRNFTVHGHNVDICTWDVYYILGLVDKGEKIEIVRKHADRKWFDLYREKGDTAITFKYLEERIPKEKDADHFSRMFVLYAIGTILAPSSKEFVSSNNLELVVDVSRIKGFNWARFTLDHLLENLAAFKTSKRTGLVGNLALLQVWFFEHFQAAGDCFNYALHEHPLIRNWDHDKVVKRARLESIKKFGAEKVVIHLEPNESKVCPDDNLDEESGDQYYEGMRHENFENKNWNENVDQEEVNQGDLHGDSKDDESRMKESLESVKILLTRFPEMHSLFQMLAAGINMSTRCEGKQWDSSGTRKSRGSFSNVHKESERASPAETTGKSEEVKPCPEPEIAAEREVFSSKLSAGAKRKVDFVSSPTLVEKVKTRKSRQPSKACKSPYTCTNQKRVPKTKTKSASVGDVTKGLKLSDLELCAIRFVQEEIAIDSNSNKALVDINGLEVTAWHMNCLVRPVKENSVEKWLDSRIIDCYSAMFNSDWNKKNEMKHALNAGQSQWLQARGQDWIQTGKPYWKVSCGVAHDLVQAEMVFIPMNTTENHWWLCVLGPARKQVQVLNSFNWSTDYQEETKELRCGIHSILQAIMSSTEKFKSRWSNYDILNWDIVVKKNIPRQSDVCSCGIFTIKYMQYWNGSELTSPFSQKDMETIRKEMPAEVIMSPFNELSSIKDHILCMDKF